MSNAFSIQNGLKQDALLPLLYNLSVQYASQKSQANHKGLQLNEAYHNLCWSCDITGWKYTYYKVTHKSFLGAFA
jgi:hypothetical protein